MSAGKLTITIAFVPDEGEAPEPSVIERQVASWKMSVGNYPLEYEIGGKKVYEAFEGSVSIDWRVKR